jgi:hypothetical protein
MTFRAATTFKPRGEDRRVVSALALAFLIGSTIADRRRKM